MAHSDPRSASEWNTSTFVDLDLPGVDLSGVVFRECSFSRAKLSESRWVGAIFEDCTFESCDLTMVRLDESRLSGIRFSRCKLMGVDFSAVRPFGLSLAFDECNLSHATFADRKMPDTPFLECRIHEASFVGVDLSRADFRGSDLSGARFVETDLTDADLSEASGYDIAPRQNRLRRTKFSREAALQLVADLGVIVP